MKRALATIGAAVGLVICGVLGLGILANVVAGTAALVLSIPLYAAVLGIALGGVGLVAWIYTRRA